MSKKFTAQDMYEALQKVPAEERKYMHIVVADVDDERTDVSDYTLCLSRFILHIPRTYYNGVPDLGIRE